MLRLVKIEFAMLLMLLSCSSLFANTKIFLLPEVEIGSSELRIGDIAVIEGPEASAIYDVVLAVRINSSIIIDKREIKSVLTERSFYGFSIFGNGVRVTFTSGSGSEGEVKNENIINNGDPVELTLYKNGVRVEVKGVSLASGAVGDTVRVRIGKGKILNAVIRSKGRVSLEL